MIHSKLRFILKLWSNESDQPQGHLIDYDQQIAPTIRYFSAMLRLNYKSQFIYLFFFQLLSQKKGMFTKTCTVL